ncbi:hypothetical protein STAN_3536 [Streptomyces sp. CBMAI 2042]|nr:hypothetical protein STAN_3536 [Streptomyces sp. CBMAI 2042]
MKSRLITKLSTLAISPPNTTIAMTGTAIHFTHQGIPATISRTAIAIYLVSLGSCLDAKGAGDPGGGLAALEDP